jgi:hypothetical protein
VSMKRMLNTAFISSWRTCKSNHSPSPVTATYPRLGGRTYDCWRWNSARQKRPMSSIVLQPGVKDMLLADCKGFLCSEEW